VGCVVPVSQRGDHVARELDGAIKGLKKTIKKDGIGRGIGNSVKK